MLRFQRKCGTFFHEIYGGGPELFVRYGNPPGPARRIDRTEGARMDNQKLEQSHSSSRSLNTDNLPKNTQVTASPVQNSTNRQRTVSASEVVKVVSTHPPKLQCSNQVTSSIESVHPHPTNDNKEDVATDDYRLQQSCNNEDVTNTNRHVHNKEESQEPSDKFQNNTRL